MKKKERIKNNDNNDDEFVYLPMCAVLNVRIPTTQHFSFIHRCSTGINSVFGGTQNALFRKLYHNINILET